MTITTFIDKAMEGGYPHRDDPDGDPYIPELNMHELLLDPLAWKAVGKSEGWYAGEHTQKAQDMIYAVFAEGKTIEEFLATL